MIVGGKDTDDKDMSFTSKVTISQESSDIVENNSDDNTIDSTDETTDSATDDSTEVVDTGNSETDFVHYNIDNVFEPIMWGKYLFYYDITAEKSIIMDMDTGITVKEMDKKTTLYRDCDDAVIILWNRDEYKDICIIGKNNDYIYEDTMYIGDENHDYAFFTRDYAINDLMTTKNNNYVYISYKDNSYSIKSVNLLDGTVTYENAVSQGVIAAKNEYYAVYSNKTTDECSILNIETGEPIATYPKSEVSLIQIILLGEHFAIWQSESGYLVDYTRYNLQGIADVEMHFSKDDKISFAQGGIERAQGMDCLSLEKREENDGGITERGLYRSDMTPILELSSEYVYYTPYHTKTIYSDVFPTYDYMNNHIGYVYTDGFNNYLEASQMVDMMESYGFIAILNNAPTMKIINIENAAIFEVSSAAEVQRIKCTGTDSYNFIVMEDDKTDIYDELGNYIFTTTVPIYYSLNDTQKMWRTKDNKFYVYNNTNEKESNIYVYNTSTATETTIATEKPVVYAFMADESNIIYSTKSKSGNYTYIMKNIETTEETELFVCKYGVLYSCNEYGFVIGKTNTDINYISDIPCDVIMYNNN